MFYGTTEFRNHTRHWVKLFWDGRRLEQASKKLVVVLCKRFRCYNSILSVVDLQNKAKDWSGLPLHADDVTLPLKKLHPVWSHKHDHQKILK